MARAGGSTAAVLGGLLALALARPLGCDPDGGKDPEVNETLLAVLADTGPEVVLPAIETALADAEGLVTATAAYAADPTAGPRDAARAAFEQAMGSWQVLELMQIGPAGSSLTAAAGADLRDRGYSWPTTNPCLVDQLTVAGGWDDPAFFEQNLVTAYGLDALDPLLYGGEDNSCPPQVDINATGSWAALGPDGVTAARAAYAAAVAAHLRDTLLELRDAWDPAGGDFAGTLAAAGADGNPYATPEEGLNALFDALFYLETRTQDRKLGRPLGLRDCAGTACVGEVEVPLSDTSHRWVAANLQGFRTLFTGGGGAGMEELLRDLGYGDVADELLARLDEADAAAAALTVPIEEAALGDPSPAVALHAAISAVTEVLEGDVATLLALRIPSEAAGDND